jgi:hypothetical protein
MKYLEELSPGDSFELEENNYILLFDYKKNGDRYCAMLTNGSTRWLKSNTIVEICPIYKLDKENNVLSIKQDAKNIIK